MQIELWFLDEALLDTQRHGTYVPCNESMNLRDLAETLGCSHMSVSRALRGAPGVSEELAKKIRSEAARQGYRVNPMVSALMQVRRQSRHSQKAVNLAFLHRYSQSPDWKKRPYSRELYLGAKKRAEQLGYYLDPVWAGEAGITPQRLHGILQARGIQGILLAPREEEVPSIKLCWEHYAIAALGFSHKSLKVHQSGTYFHHAIPIVCHELRQLGYRHIGIVTSPRSSIRYDFAWEAGIAAIQNQSRTIQFTVLRTESLSQRHLTRWLQQKQIDVVINIGFDRILDMIEKAGIRVPETMGYVSLLDEDNSASVIRNWGGIGAAAVDLVDYQLMRNERGLPAEARTVLIEGKWNPGKTLRAMK